MYCLRSCPRETWNQKGTRVLTLLRRRSLSFTRMIPSFRMHFHRLLVHVTWRLWDSIRTIPCLPVRHREQEVTLSNRARTRCWVIGSSPSSTSSRSSSSSFSFNEGSSSSSSSLRSLSIQGAGVAACNSEDQKKKTVYFSQNKLKPTVF